MYNFLPQIYFGITQNRLEEGIFFFMCCDLPYYEKSLEKCATKLNKDLICNRTGNP
jgi:hypothetical protein